MDDFRVECARVWVGGGALQLRRRDISAIEFKPKIVVVYISDYQFGQFINHSIIGEISVVCHYLYTAQLVARRGQRMDMYI